MITFFNRLLAKSGSWIITILLAVLVVSFVFYVGNSPGLTPREEGLDDFNYYGVSLTQNSKEWRDIQQRSAILAEMENGSLLNNPQFARFAPQIIQSTAQRYALQNLPLSILANEIGLPEASTEEIQEFIAEQSLFHDSQPNRFAPASQGAFKREKLTDFLDRLEANSSRDAFDIAVREALLVQKLREAIDGPGRTLPFEAEAKVRTDQTQWSVGLAVLEKAKGKDAPKVEDPTDEDLQPLYEETKDTYAPKARRKVSYLAFTAQYPHPTSAQLEEYYKKHQKRYAKDLEAEEDKQDADKPKPEVKEEKKPEEKPMKAYAELDFFTRQEVLEDYKVDNNLVAPALKTAQNRAESLLDQIYNEANPLSREQTNELLAKLNLKPNTHLAPFVEKVYPKKQLIGALNAPFVHHKATDQENTQAEKILELAFTTLDTDRYYTEPYRIGDAYVILFLDKIHDSAPPTFEEIKKNLGKFNQLKKAWKEQKEEEIFSEKREEVEKALKEKLEAGKTLPESITTTDVGKGWVLSHKTQDKFKSTKLPDGLPQQVFDTVKELSQGQHSDMVAVEEKAYLLTLKEKLVPGYTMDNKEVKDELFRMSRSSRDSVSQELVKRGQAAMKVNIFAPADTDS